MSMVFTIQSPEVFGGYSVVATDEITGELEYVATFCSREEAVRYELSRSCHVPPELRRSVRYV